MQLDVHSNVQKQPWQANALCFCSIWHHSTQYSLVKNRKTTRNQVQKNWPFSGSRSASLWWKCRTRRLKMAASQNKATIKLDSRQRWQKWTFRATSCTHYSPIERRSVPYDQLQWFNSTNCCLIEGWMAIVEPNLHRLNRLRCFSWDPTRPEMNKIQCTGHQRLESERHTSPPNILSQTRRLSPLVHFWNYMYFVSNTL